MQKEYKEKFDEEKKNNAKQLEQKNQEGRLNMLILFIIRKTKDG